MVLILINLDYLAKRYEEKMVEVNQELEFLRKVYLNVKTLVTGKRNISRQNMILSLPFKLF